VEQSPVAAPEPTTPVAAEPAAPPSLSGLSPAERSSWQLTGKLPGETAEAPVETKPAETPAPVEGDPNKKPTRLDTRKSQIQQEIDALVRDRELARREIEAIRAEQRAYESQRSGSTAPQPQAQPNAQNTPASHLQNVILDPADPEPDVARFQQYEHFVDARNQWVRRGEDRFRGVQQQQWQAQQYAQQVEQTYAERCQAFASTTPDFHDVINAIEFPMVNGQPATPTAASVLQHVKHSEFGPQLAYALGQSPDELTRILSLAPGFAVAALGRLEARLDPGFAATAGAPAPKLISSAPTPPPTVGTKPTAPVDDLESAVKSEDFSRFRRVANARSVAARA